MVEAGESPVTYEGNSIFIDTKLMQVGHQYEVNWRGKSAFAMLNADGSIDLYRDKNVLGEISCLLSIFLLILKKLPGLHAL